MRDSTSLNSFMADEIKQFAADVDRLVKALEKLPSQNAGNQSTITLNAGGVGVWVAVTACAVMLALNLALMIVLVSHDRKIDQLNHYLSAIYMVAPGLKPEDIK
jgi:hypothetical protein